MREAQADALQLTHRLPACARFLRAIESKRAGEEARGKPAIGAEQDVVEHAHPRSQLHVLEGSRDAGARDPKLALRAYLPPIENDRA